MSTPEWSQLFQLYIDADRRGLHTMLPARVESYDASTGLVSCAPLIRRVYTDASGAQQTETLPVVKDIPALFLGGGSYRTTYPIAVGDFAMLVTCEAAINRWVQGDGEPVDPDSDRRHHLSDGIALVGLFPVIGNPGANSSDMVIGNAVDGHSIRIDESNIDVGGTSELATKADVAAVVNAITTSAVGSADGGTLYKTNMTAALAGIPAGTTVLRGG